MSEFDEKACANARSIESEIGMLSHGHWNMFKRQYKSFWSHAKKISDMFRTLKPLHNDDRQKLWEKFSSICNEVKAKQASEHENREFQSKQHRNEIISEAESARVCTLFGFAPPDVQEMKSLGRTLRNASSLLSKYKEEMFGEHKQECFKLTQEIRHIHDLWWNELKQQRSKRQEEFQQRIRANLEKNYERHRKATDALRRVRNHADDLRSQISSAWNDDFRDRAYGWLSETEEKIRDIEDSIRQIEDWISEDEDKLR